MTDIKQEFENLREENESLALILEDQTATLQKVEETLRIILENVNLLSKSVTINSVKLDRFSDEIKNSRVQTKRTTKAGGKITKRVGAPRENIVHWIKNQCTELGIVKFFDQFIEKAEETVEEFIDRNKEKINKKKDEEDRKKYTASVVWSEIKKADKDKNIVKAVRELHEEWIEKERRKNVSKLENKEESE